MESVAALAWNTHTLPLSGADNPSYRYPCTSRVKRLTKSLFPLENQHPYLLKSRYGKVRNLDFRASFL
jgi:hypothetical protein